MEKIKLEWMNRIRKRLKENAIDETGETTKYLWGRDEYIQQFIKPIIEYGEAEEERINKEFKKRK